MIIGERKPIPEILTMLGASKKVLVLGCGTCVTVCLSGGDQEAQEMAALVRIKGYDTKSLTVERQCELEFINPLRESIQSVDTVVSLACGIGVQALFDLYPEKNIFPGLNTTFMGMPVKQGYWEERCLGCGNCIVHLFGGTCPITRCAKSLLNGPCGGSKEGKCEVKPDRDCAWQLIYDRLKKLNHLDWLLSIQPPKDWSTSRYGGQRKMIREDIWL